MPFSNVPALTFVSVACALVLLPATSHALLYNKFTLIEELGTSSFNASIYNQTRDFVYLVEFYNSWCGHCQAFAPKYEALAESVEPWRRWVRVAAVDCSADNNFNLCSGHNIVLTPTLLFFRPFPLSSKNGTADNNTMHSYFGDSCKECDHEVFELKETIARYLVVNVEHLPAIGKNLLPINDSLDEEAAGNGRTAKNVEAVVFEGPKSLLGIDLILRLAHIARNVSIYRSLSIDLALKYGAGGKRPALVITHANINENNGKSPAREIFSYPAANYPIRLRKFIESVGRYDAGVALPGMHAQRLALIVKEGSRRNINMTRSGGDTGGCDMTKMPEFLRPNAKDINSGIVHSVRAEVLSNAELRGKKKHALRRYVRMLLKFTPLTPPIRGALERLSKVLEKSENETVQRAQLEAALRLPDMNNVSLTSLPLNWTACRASKPGLRGYPCSLWITFHTITVGAYNASQQNTTSNNSAHPNALDSDDGALLAIQGYIENFFSCRECVKHFMKMWRKFEQSLSSINRNNSSDSSSFNASSSTSALTNEQALVWLWKAHNQVNARLAGDVTEDPHFPKVKFPPRSLCVECYGSGELASLDTLNETSVIPFLQSWFSYPMPTTNDALTAR